MTYTSLSGKRVLVTGAGTGIGRGIAEHFAKESAEVVLHYSHSPEAVAVADRITEAGGRAFATQADFNDPDQTRNLVAQTVDLLGGLDIVVNNAGITFNAPLEETSLDQFQTLLNVNLRAMFLIAQAAVPIMAKQASGVILNLSSNHAFLGLQEHAVYAATKGAIVSMSRALAVELGPKGIRVNVIAPAHVHVENHNEYFPEADLEASGQKYPLGRVGVPEDVAHLAAFLASDASSWITGQTYVIDGGHMATLSASEDFRKPIGYRMGHRYV